MVRSLWTAATGMNGQQSNIDAISNNLSNVNTTGYKQQRVEFEDLVYHYDSATKKLRDFLNLGENPNPKSIFDPSMSMANTQIWKRYPEFQKDIEYIERELKEYLFDFEGCPEPDVNAKMFSGRSPKKYKMRIR